VVQNFISSLLNSHLFDFHEGWIYVLGVGVAGGMAARAQRLSDSVQATNSPRRDLGATTRLRRAAIVVQ